MFPGSRAFWVTKKDLRHIATLSAGNMISFLRTRKTQFPKKNISTKGKAHNILSNWSGFDEKPGASSAYPKLLTVVKLTLYNTEHPRDGKIAGENQI